MNILSFEVDKRNNELFEARLSRLMAGCEAHELICRISHDGSETREFPIIEKKKQVGTYTVDYDRYTLNWEEPTSERYEYVGVLKEVGNSNILEVNGEFKNKYLNNEYYDIGIPDEIYHVELECEHCMSGRSLTKSHVIFDFATDMFFQVAKGCLTGYIYFSGNRNVEYEFKSLDVYEDLEKVDWGRNRRVTNYEQFDKLCQHSLSYFLKQEELEYISRFKASVDKVLSTATIVIRELDTGDITDEALNLYPSFIDYLLTESDIDSANLEVMITENLAPDFKWGYFIYLAFKFLKSLQKKEFEETTQELKQTSEYVGEIGDKIEIEVTYYNYVDFDTDFGTKTMYFFKSDEGNVFVWSTLSNLNVEKDTKLKLKGKVVRHNEFRGVKQTFLSYVKIIGGSVDALVIDKVMTEDKLDEDLNDFLALGSNEENENTEKSYTFKLELSVNNKNVTITVSESLYNEVSFGDWLKVELNKGKVKVLEVYR